MPIYKTEKRKDGKQQYRVCVNFTDKEGSYRQKIKLVYGAIEAKNMEMLLAAELSKTGDAGPSRITVKELFDMYCNQKQYEVRQSTFEKSKSILEREIVPYFGDTRLDKLNSQLLQKWKNSVSERDLSPRTRKNIYSEFRAMLNYAVKMEYISKNPLFVVGNFKEVYFEKPQDKLHYYTPEQFKKYIAEAKKNCKSLNDYGYYVFFNIAFYTGMRKGEINALKWSDIEGNTIHVRRSVAQKLKGADVETPPKNKTSYRDIQMPKNLIEILNEHKHRQTQTRGFSDDFRVCGGISFLRDTSIENKNKKFAKDAELEHIRIHDFRHSHASLLANNGINIQEIARRLGHSNIEITWNTYSHLYPKEEERAVKLLESI